MRKFFIFIIFSFIISACGRQPFEKFEKVENRVWTYSAPKQFVVDIKEPGMYKLLVQLRYTDEYTYSNIWLGLTEKKPDGTSEKTRFNIPLFDIKGKPFGSFAGRFYDRSYPDAEVDGQKLTLSFPKVGQYTLVLQHNMRTDALSGIAETGIRLKKAD